MNQVVVVPVYLVRQLISLQLSVSSPCESSLCSLLQVILDIRAVHIGNVVLIPLSSLLVQKRKPRKQISAIGKVEGFE